MEGRSFPIHIDRIPEILNILQQYINDDFWKILLAQGKNFPSSRHHPWAQPYYSYRNKKMINKEIIIMASQIFALAEFIDYWTNPKIVRQIVNKIKNPDEFESLIFEFNIAFHFKKCLGYDVQLTSIPVDGNKIGDMLVSNGADEIEVECSRKRDKPERSIFNLANYLHKEAGQFSGKNPGLIAIHIPELTDWQAIGSNRELGKYIQQEFEKEIFKSINAVFYSCDQDPKHKYNTANFRESYDTSIEMICYENPNAIYRLPDWFQIY